MLTFFFPIFLAAQIPNFDVETLPYQRTECYSSGPYKKIVVFSAPRTGSSLIYNICRFCFEKAENLSQPHHAFNKKCTVLKTHKYTDLNLLKEEDVLYLVPIRQPINASISNYRICPHPDPNIKEFSKVLIYRQRDHLLHAEKMISDGNHVQIIRYEDFVNDFDHLFDVLEATFSISISDLDKETLKNGYKKENVSAAIEDLADFKEYLPLSGFHGDHIGMDDYAPPDALVYWLNQRFKDVAPIFKKYGY